MSSPGWHSQPGVGVLDKRYLKIDASNDPITGNLDISKALQLSGDISPAQITSNEDNFNPTGLADASTLRLSTDASRDITGLVGGTDGRLIIIHNIGSFDIVLKDENASSTAANRFALEADRTIAADGVVVLQYDSTTTRWRAVSAGAGGIGQNILINGGFDVWQRGTSFTAGTVTLNNDDTYLTDRWILLSDGNDTVDVSQQTSSPPEGARYYQRSLVATADRKFGHLTILEAQDSIPLRGKSVSLSFQAKTTGAAIRNIRAAVVSWDGTADSVTSDVVSAWGSEGANPTLVANWTFENTATDLALAASFQTFTINGISLDTSGLNNIGVFIWVDDTDAATSDILDLATVKLEIRATATDYVPNSIVSELNKSLRYYAKSYESGTDPGTSTSAGAFRFQTRTATAGSTAGSIQQSSLFGVRMRNAPTVLIYQHNAVNVTSTIAIGAADRQGVTAGGVADNGFSFLSVDDTDSTAIALDERIIFQYTADAEL